MPLQRSGKPSAERPGRRELEIEERRRVVNAPARRDHDQDRKRIHPVRDAHDEGMDLYRLPCAGRHIPSLVSSMAPILRSGAPPVQFYVSEVTLDAGASPFLVFRPWTLASRPWTLAPRPSVGSRLTSHASRLLWQTVGNFTPTVRPSS